MKYTVITNKGTVKQFYIESVAKMYCSLNGGVVITEDILVDTQTQTVV